MNCLISSFNSRLRPRRMSLARIVALCAPFFLTVPGESRASSAFSYDLSGDQISQQTGLAAAPVITTQPVNQGNSPAAFTVIVASATPVTYQWQFNGVNIVGATSDSYLIGNVIQANEGNYTVTVTNSVGSVTSTAAKLFIDTNGNGIDDFWELKYFGNLNQTANGDYDGDGITNLNKYLDGLNPTIPTPWVWIAASGDFNTPANWNYQRYRSPGPGDVCSISTGTFSISSQITAGQVTINVPFAVPTTANYTLNVTGAWTFNGAFTLAAGYQFAVTGGGSVTVAGTTNLNGASLNVTGTNSALNFASITSYTQPASTSATWTVGQAGTITTGCQLSFPALTTITAATTSNYLSINAQYGAAINLAALTTITVPQNTVSVSYNGVQISATNSGTISAPLLNSFTDQSTTGDGHNSSLTANVSGVLTLPKLTAVSNVNLNLNDVSNPQLFTSITGGVSFTLNAGVVSMPLSNITGLNSINVSGTNSKLSFPNVTSYTQPLNTPVAWTAGAYSSQPYPTGCELDFPAPDQDYR